MKAYRQMLGWGLSLLLAIAANSMLALADDSARVEEESLDGVIGAEGVICEEGVISEEGVVGEDGVNDEGVVGDGIVDGDVVDDAVESGSWPARRITVRDVAGRQAFVRQSSVAYEDPDQPRSLELKYYFDLGDEPLPFGGQFDRIRPLEPERPVRLDLDEDYEGPSGVFPLSISNDEPSVCGEWIDYRSKLRPRQVVLLAPASSLGGGPIETSDAAGLWMIACRVRTDGVNRLLVSEVDARRTIDAAQLVGNVPLAMAVDTWDKPSLIGNGSAFLGRVIAVLKHDQGRYAVDFYGDVLHEDSDCRVWLSTDDDPLGTPVGIRFVEIPIKKDADRVVDVAVTGVTYLDPNGQTRTIAFDFPLCESPVMRGLRQVAKFLETASDGQAFGREGGAGDGQDLEKIVGEDLLDELSRRLVNAQYH